MSLGILCPGQGTQGVGMIELIEGEVEAERILALAAPVLGGNVRDILRDRPKSIYLNDIAQPLLCAVQLATWQILRDKIPRPSVFAGYSVGELAAYGCAGVFDAADTLALAAARARAMTDACHEPSQMTAVRGARRAAVEKLATEHGVYVAIVIEPDHFVIGGLSGPMQDFENAARATGACVTKLRVTVASHTPLLISASARLKQAIEAVPSRPPNAPVLSGIDGSPVLNAEGAARSLRAQLHTTLNWAACLESLRERGCTALLELGPGDSLSRMVRRTLPDVAARSLSEFRTLAGVIAWANKASR